MNNQKRENNSKRTIEQLSLSMEMEVMLRSIRKELSNIGTVLEATKDFNGWSSSHLAITMIIYCGALVAQAEPEFQAGLLSAFPKLFKRSYDAEKASQTDGTPGLGG